MGIGDLVYEILENADGVLDDLQRLGFDWISFTDNYPDYAEAWAWLGHDDLEGRRLR